MSSANNGESSNNNNARAIIIVNDANRPEVPIHGQDVPVPPPVDGQLYDAKVSYEYDQYRFNPGKAGPSRNSSNPRKRTRKRRQAGSAGPSSSNANNPRVAGINAHAQNPGVAGNNVNAQFPGMAGVNVNVQNLGVGGSNANAQNPGASSGNVNARNLGVGGRHATVQNPRVAGSNANAGNWMDSYGISSNHVRIPNWNWTPIVLIPNSVEGLSTTMANMSVTPPQHEHNTPESSNLAIVIYQGPYQDSEVYRAMVGSQDPLADDETGVMYATKDPLPYIVRTRGWYITHREVNRKGKRFEDPFYHHCRSDNKFRTWPEVISYINDNSLPVQYPPGEAPPRRQPARTLVDLFFVGYCRVNHEPQGKKFRFLRNRERKLVSTSPVMRGQDSGPLMEGYEHHLYDIVPHAQPTAE